MQAASRLALPVGFSLALAAGCDAGETSKTSSSAGTGGAEATGSSSGSTGSAGGGAAGSSGTGASSTSSSSTGSTSTSGSTTSSSSTSSSGGSTAGLHVAGNKLMDGAKTVRLLGVNRSGTEYTCLHSGGAFDGPVDQTAVSAITSWHANAVRVPLNEDCWLGINGAQFGGSGYQGAISQWVSLLRQNGLYVIVDLHWNNGGGGQATGQQQMADADHAPAFWTGVASAFKGDLGVVFDLYNEPHDISWGCWRDGGCQVNGWNVAGMNQLISAVRGTGAKNVVMAGGISYSGDLSQWLAYKPTDSAGNLAASFHSYNFSNCHDSGCWGSQLQPVAAQVPLITGELGENDCAHGYIDGFMPWADGQGVSYLGWAWNSDFGCGSGPSLITDYGGTPSGMGAGFKAHLLIENP